MLTATRLPKAAAIPLLGFTLLLALAMIGVIGMTVASQMPYDGDATACTVESKDRATNSSGGSDMRVYTDCGVFQVADNALRLHFTSADVYASLKEGETYDFEATGFRFGLLSMFPNILSAEVTR